MIELCAFKLSLYQMPLGKVKKKKNSEFALWLGVIELCCGLW